MAKHHDDIVKCRENPIYEDLTGAKVEVPSVLLNEPKQYCLIIKLYTMNATLTVYRDKRELQGTKRKIYCKGDWYNAEYYKLALFSYYFTLTKCFLEVPDDAFRMHKSRQFATSLQLPLGKREADEEESTEDELIFYF